MHLLDFRLLNSYFVAHPIGPQSSYHLVTLSAFCQNHELNTHSRLGGWLHMLANELEQDTATMSKVKIECTITVESDYPLFTQLLQEELRSVSVSRITVVCTRRMVYWSFVTVS